MKIFMYSTYPFVLQPPSLSIQRPFNQSHLLEK